MRVLKKLIVGLLIAWGVLALAVRALTPLLAEYRGQLEAAASERLGTPVSIGTLRARWYGIRPLLELADIRLGQAPMDLRVARAEVDLAPLDLLRGTWADAVRVTLDGLHLTAVREVSGQVHLEGLSNGGGPAIDGRAELPAHLRLVNTRVIWNDRKRNRPPLPIDNIDITLDRSGDHARLRAGLRTPAGNARLAAQVSGRLRDLDWSGDSYLEVDGVDVARLLAAYLPDYYGLDSAMLDLRSWTRWEGAAPVFSQGDFAVTGLALRPRAGNTLDIERLASGFTLAHAGGHLELGLRDLDLRLSGHRWPLTNLALSIDSDAQGMRTLAIAADYLRLDDASTILGVRPPDPELAGLLPALAPRGELRGLRLHGTRTDGGFDWRGRTDFAGVGSEPSQKVPGVDNLSGRAFVDGQRIRLDLDSRDARIRFASLFRDPIELARLDGRIEVARDETGITVASQELVADTPHIRTVTRLRYEKPSDGPAFLDLQSDFRDGDAAFASRYYPVAIMSPKLVDWLDHSIKSGHVVSGSALVHGRLDEFAFENSRSGSFQVVFDAEDVQLDYRAGWPALSGLGAHVRFHGNQLDISASAGRIYDSTLRHLDAHIASLHPVSPIVIRGAVDGPLGDELRILKEDALRTRFGHFAEILRAEGAAGLELDLQVPLGHDGSTALDGTLMFRDNRLTLPDWDFALDGIDGKLQFTLDGLSASGIRALMLGTPVAVDVGPAGNGMTRVRARGPFAADTLLARVAELPGTIVTGKADFTVDVDVPAVPAGDTHPVMLAIRSDLRGIGVDLPPPLGKHAPESRALAIQVPLSGTSGAGRIGYGDKLDAWFSRDGQRIEVVLGGGRANPRIQRGTHVSGRVDLVDVGAWSDAAGRLPAASTGDTPVSLNLAINRAHYDELHLDGVELDAERDSEAWRGVVHADNLAGRFVVPVRPGRSRITIELERLALTLPPEDGTPPPPPPDPNTGPDPATLPGLALDIADLQVDAAHLGRLSLRALADAEGLQITRLGLDGGQLQLDAAGHWSHDGGGYRTQLGGHVATADLGQLLVDLGYSRQLVDASATSEFLLTWPGNPAQAHRGTLAGKLDVSIGKGRLLDLDPGVTRVVGLLNLNALTRRLRLDFSDFYKKGYSFDSIAGGFVFEHGIATTEDLSMDGPTGRIDVRGRTDLVAESLDQKVMVTPDFDATLPIAGTLAGGPVAGLAVLVAQKVMDKQVDKLNRFDYAVKGPWNEPEVTPLDSGGTLSKLLKPFRKPATTPENAAPSTPDGIQTPSSTDSADPVDVDAPTAAVPPPADKEPGVEQQGSEGPLNGLIDFLKSGKPHGADLPGSEN